MIGNGQLIEALEGALDSLEGDIDEAQLLKALEVMKLYPNVCDKNKSVPRYTKAKIKFIKSA